MTSTIVILIILWIIIIYIIIIYNKLVKLKNNRENSFSDIDVQLKMRADLIPQLLESIKWYMNHEKETLQKVTEARTSFLNSNTVDEKVQSGNMLEWTLKSLFAVSESYPDLKANQNFLQMQNEMSNIENKLASSRRYFNSSTKELNTYVEIFPSNIIAPIFGFNKKEYFEIDNREELEKAPKISFN